MAFLAPIGMAVAGAAAATAGAATALTPILTAAGAGASIYNATRSGPKLPGLPGAVRTPDYRAIEAAETSNVLRANQKRTKTILTSPLGVTDSSSGTVQKKQLLGQ